MPARIRRDRLRHHDHAVGGRRDRAHLIANPFDAGVDGSPAARHAGAAARRSAAIFLRGFREAIVARGRPRRSATWRSTWSSSATGFVQSVAASRRRSRDWKAHAASSQQSNPLMMVAIAMLLFPKLALGLSGFETGVAVMPLVAGERDGRREEAPIGRIAQHQEAAADRGADHERAAHRQQLRDGDADSGRRASPRAAPPTAARSPTSRTAISAMVRDASTTLTTIAILWFAGASAMAGLLNLVPRYLPRYGMAPDWARANAPARACSSPRSRSSSRSSSTRDVDAQGGAYATGVLVLMTSAALAVAIAAWRQKQPLAAVPAASRSSSSTRRSSTSSSGRKASRSPRCSSSRSSCRRWCRAPALDRDPHRRRRPTTLADAVSCKTVGTARRSASSPIARTTGSLEEYERQARGRAADRTICRRTTRCCSSRSARATRREFSNVLHVHGAYVGAVSRAALAEPGHPQRDRGAAALPPRSRPGRSRTRTSAGPKAIRSPTCLKFLAFGEGDTAPVTREVLAAVRARSAAPAARARRLTLPGGRNVCL